MAFKMKGSAFKLNNVATKSALKQKVDHASIHGGAEDKKYDLLSAEGDYNFVGGSLPSANVVKHKKGNYLKGTLNDQFADRHEKSYILKNFGNVSKMSRRELLDAKRDYYNYLNLDGNKPEIIDDTKKEVVKQPVVSANQKGEEPTEFTKHVRKGYFNKGGGSDYLANRPNPSDYDSAADFTAAVKEWELTNPELSKNQ